MIHQVQRSTQVGRTTHSPKRRVTPIYAPGRRHPVGQVVGDAFIKHIAFSKHTLRSPRAIAFDVSTLDDAERAGVVVAEIHDTESRNVWTAPIALIRSKGFPVRRGFGNQWTLTLEHWSRNGLQSEAEAREEQQAAKQAAASVVQLGLFGGGL